MANKLLGQHFLKDPSGTIIGKIIDAIAPARAETIIEIGAGHGELTRPLMDACRENGARLIAIEKDPRLAEKLEKEFGTRYGARPNEQDKISGGIRIVHGDALKILGDLVEEKNIRPGTYKLVGNIPYYLTGHLLRIAGELDPKPSRCVFMVQKEVAERALAAPPRMNRLAASVQFSAEPKVIATVSKENFSPMPQVDSAILLLETHLSINDDTNGKGSDANIQIKKRSILPSVTPGQYYAAVRTLFAQPRKTVLNNLITHAKKEDVLIVLRDLHIDPDLRPQNLNVEAMIAIARVLWG